MKHSFETQLNRGNQTVFKLSPHDTLTITALTPSITLPCIIINRNQHNDFFCPTTTIAKNNTYKLTLGNTLFSNNSTPLLSIIEDSFCNHTILMPPCKTPSPKESCHHRLRQVLSRYSPQQHAINNCFKVFGQYFEELNGNIFPALSAVQKKDFITLKAHHSLILITTICTETYLNQEISPHGSALITLHRD
jgi:uncharacterized protein YcgI (DUF1989 family)